MRRIFLTLAALVGTSLMLAASASGQLVVERPAAGVYGGVHVDRPQPAIFDPAADYITPGQDEPGFRAWVAAGQTRPMYVKAFNDYMVNAGVGGVAPTWQLLRTATDWEKCGAQPFEIPPTEGWPNIVAALRYVGAFVEPVIGPVEPVSVYRNPDLNRCAGGAVESTHRTVGAIDMVPLRPINRELLMASLCQLHEGSGTWNHIGLGIYKGIRFHIDSKKYREWGTQAVTGAAGCTAVLAGNAKRYDPAAAVRPPITRASAMSPAAVAILPAPRRADDPLAPLPGLH